MSLPALPPLPAVIFICLTFPLLVLSATTSHYPGHVVFKLLSSTAFLSGAILSPPTVWASYQGLITIGLGLSFLGDICLLPSPPRGGDATRSTDPEQKIRGDIQQHKPSIAFEVGVLAFAGAHVAYIVAFLRQSEDIAWLTFAATFALSMLLVSWLGIVFPAWKNALNLDVPLDMRPLLVVYAAIISTMLGLSASTTDSSASWPRQRLLGAVMFVLSDIFVAYDSFSRVEGQRGGKPRPGMERHGWKLISVGYGLYFWVQMILAGTAFGS